MKQFLLTLLSCYISAICFAQTQNSPTNITVKGSVIDSAINKPLGYVTVALQDATTHAPVKSTLAKDDGSFELKAPDGKTYQLVVAFIGYATKILPVKLTGNEFNAGKILLAPSNKELKEVTVTAVRPTLKQEVDRLTYDVTADPESKAVSALDMMRKVPLLSVDGDDNIKLKGSGNYKILINGKESALMAKSPSDVLKAMPATNIEKIEVITTPPAKYDAEGLTGIINIITKKNADQGYNGSINARYNSVWGPGYNLNATVKQGKFGLSGYAGFGTQKQVTGVTHNTQTQFVNQSVSSILNQDGSRTFGGNYKYANAELSYEIDSLDLITGSFEIFQGHFDQNGFLQSNRVNNVGTLDEAYRNATTSNSKDKGADIAMNYQRNFKNHKDELLTLSYKYSYSPSNQTSSNAFTDRFNYDAVNNPDFRQRNNAGNREHTIQLDYVYPLKKLNIEAGAKAILRNNFSDFGRDDFDPNTSQYVVNTGQTSTFDYHQDVTSFYNSYQLKLSKWTVKAGLRIEHTQVTANFVGTPLDKGYNNLIPSISIQRSLNSSSINFGFTQRIQRPGIYQLNPFVDNSNPKFISTGNPDLRPELNNTFDLTYSNFKKASVTVGLSYAFSNNSIQTISSLRDTVTYTTYQNLGSNRTLGFNVNTNFSIIKPLTVSLNGQISHVWLKGVYNDQFFRNGGYIGNAFASFTYKLGDTYRFGYNAGFFSGDVTLQGKSSNFIYNSYTVAKDLFKKKFTVTLVANNPYSKYRAFTNTTNTPDFSQTISRENPYRHFAIRVNYKFGKLSSDIKKNQRSINNDDTKNGSKSSGASQ
ncbi:Outer membrane receptor proteins, mostly Fe transport [Mucilaginibacter lappiensis]|uniref:Outer membrane receptor protein involved in Fe transport n=1 Tax=Mucilaginibacter lappiensis TaxID=354630 RepID=A0ABR6PR33_9SPHI|nr:TonB-dependent receptor [Mucilaginibacter lappiensis]MBB6112033.1 outer membrane receptor protein involved in Fe transport [Mucilaginibacter lappiensis]SIR95686.1 Outer membrane receptor proteins, mostly Fe transport [Mucilaginibacter lappiensis]